MPRTLKGTYLVVSYTRTKYTASDSVENLNDTEKGLGSTERQEDAEENHIPEHHVVRLHADSEPRAFQSALLRN
ncbi:UNVERIFIED_CONTAM: hypothetical protein FKN15_008230 [Acipenser sinensis]